MNTSYPCGEKASEISVASFPNNWLIAATISALSADAGFIR
jgi:hypothetical protein